jgi:succinate dehydrogenase hydrophobic anchor subunit
MAERRSSAKLGSHLWMLHDTANMHVGVMVSLAGLAFTGVALVVTLAHDRTGVAEISLDTFACSPLCLALICL